MKLHLANAKEDAARRAPLGRLWLDLQRAVQRNFQPDRRSLVAFRVMLALGLLLDLTQRLRNAPYFYSEDGILPQEIWETLFGVRAYYWSLHFLSPGLLYALLLFQIVLAFALLVGYRTRLVSLLSWVLMLSLVLRNPLLHYGGDKLAPILLLIAAWLPLSHPFGRVRNAPRTQSPVAPVAPVAYVGFLWLLTQMAVLYIASGASKLGSSFWQNGTALRNVFDMNMLVRPLGLWFAQFEPLLHLMSLATPWAEIILPLLFFVPLWRGRLRALAVLGLLALNLGIHTMLDVGFFMFYASAGLLALLPTAFWDDSARALRPLITLVATLSSKLTSTRLGRRAATLFGRPDVPGANVEQGDRRAKGAIRTAGEAASTALATTLALIFAALTVATGLESMNIVKLTYPPHSWTLIRGLNLYQNWGLFTNPSTVATWYVAKAQLANGTWVDTLQEGGPVVWAHQERPNALFEENSKWRLAMAKANSYDDEEALFDALGRALAAKWNCEHAPDEALVELTIYKLTQPLPAQADVGRTWKKWLVWKAKSPSLCSH